MGEVAAVNASPLIFLSKAARLGFLRLVADEIIVPSAVAGEIAQRGRDDPTARALAATPWLTVGETPVVPSKIQKWDLGPGESAVLAWCLDHPGREAIIDDLAARHCAKTFGIPVRETLGLVLVAKQRGEIPRARPVLEEMRRAGFYLSDKILDEALRRVGE